MMKLVRTDSNNPDFIELVKLLDADLAIMDGKDHSFYAQYNKIDKIKYVIVAYENEKPVACGAIKKFSESEMEVKRMFTLPAFRGKGFATKILLELENWARELNFEKCILETGKKQPDAIELYRKNNYTVMPNYGQYTGVVNSVCFEKIL